LINLEEKGEGAEALDAGKTAILNALHATLGRVSPASRILMRLGLTPSRKF